MLGVVVDVSEIGERGCEYKKVRNHCHKVFAQKVIENMYNYRKKVLGKHPHLAPPPPKKKVGY